MNNKELKRLVELLDKGSSKRVATYNKTLLKQYKEALNFTRGKLNDLFAKLGNTATFSEASIRLKNIESQLVEEISKLNKNSTQIITKGITDSYNYNYTGFNNIIGKAIETDITFGLISKQSVNASVVNPFNWQGSQAKYSTQLLTGIKNTVTQGLLAGKSYPTMLEEVTNKFNISANNAYRILRTETHRNESAARIDSITNAQQIGESLGYDVLKKWSAFIDNRTRQSHIDLDNTEADADGMFNVGGILCEGPGMSGDPAEDINCRCSITIEIIDKKDNKTE